MDDRQSFYVHLLVTVIVRIMHGVCNVTLQAICHYDGVFKHCIPSHPMCPVFLLLLFSYPLCSSPRIYVTNLQSFVVFPILFICPALHSLSNFITLNNARCNNNTINQVDTNSRCQVAMVMKFGVVAPNICGSLHGSCFLSPVQHLEF
jgi:hypothetical protein